jgi:hypothetical protein
LNLEYSLSFFVTDDALTTYAADIEDSIRNHLLPDGVFVFTSSGGVFTENSGNIIDEKSPVAAEGRNKAILVNVQVHHFEI